jgi:hypothetical protein
MTKIDFIILWVDNNDPTWLKDFKYHSLKEKGIKSDVRYRSWDNLQYWFRGVEKFTPWVNNIFFITSGHLPSWLDTRVSNLKIIKHSDFIPIDLLPTFSSSVIEMFVHKIENLSEHFVMFNDDFFIINHLNQERFFKNKLPCDISAFNVYHGFGLSTNIIACLELLNKNFDQRKSLRKLFFKWFSFQNNKLLFRTVLLSFWPYFVGFYDHHLPQPFLKSIYKEVWTKEGNLIYESLNYKFRQRTNITNYLIRYWQLASGNYYCKNVLKDSIYIGLNNENLSNAIDIIKNQSKCIIVLNDTENTDFERSKKPINEAFHEILPFKSKYEL